MVADAAKNSEALKMLKKFKVIAITATVVTAVGAGAVYVVHRIKERKIGETQEYVVKFQRLYRNI